MLDALTLDQMRVFLAVAETGSFRAGAGRVARAQSAVSYAIANLEGQLSVALFDRSAKRPTLTAEGRALLADVRGILLRVEALRARAGALKDGVEPGISIAIDPLFPLPRLVAALGALRAEYPSVAVRTWTAPLGAALNALLEGRCQIAVTLSELPHPQVEVEPLLQSSLVAVVAAEHPLAALAQRSAGLSAVALAEHLQIVVEDPSPLTEGREYGIFSPDTWRVSDLSTKQALILAGIGWGNLPAWMVERDLAEGALVRVPVAALGAEGETPTRAYLARRIDHALGPATRAFRDALRRQR